MHTNFKRGKWRALEIVQCQVEVSKLVSGDNKLDRSISSFVFQMSLADLGVCSTCLLYKNLYCPT